MKQEKIKVGILGCGRFAMRRLLPELKKIPYFSLLGIHNRTLKKAQTIASQYQAPFYTDSEKELIEHPELDALIITSPNYQHKTHILKGLERNLALFTEKPLTPSYANSLQILEKLKPSDILLVGHCYRFKSAIQKAKEFIKDGHLGDLLSLNVHTHMSIPQTGWRFQKKYGGGVTLELGVHVIDSIRYLSGVEFKSIYALDNSRKDTDREDVDISIHALAQLENNLPASFSVSFNSPYSTGFTLKGTKGSLESTYTLRGDDDDKETLTFQDLSENRKKLPLSPQNIYFQELKHFADVIQGSSSLLTAENGARNIEVIEALQTSLKTQKQEEVNSSILI